MVCHHYILRPPPAQANTRRIGNWLERKGTLPHVHDHVQTTSQGTGTKKPLQQTSELRMFAGHRTEWRKKMYFYKLAMNNWKCIQIFTTMKNKQTWNLIHIWSVENYQTLRRWGKGLNKRRDLCAHRLWGWPIPIRPTTLRVAGGTLTLSPKAVRFLDSRRFPGTSKPKLTIQRYIASPIWHN